MNKSVALSVLVPCYNVEQYISICLDSIVAQSFDDYEVICINDGSTDTTLAILQSYADKDSRFSIIDKPNSGYGASMNAGLEKAHGQYIAILESDDFFEPNTLETLYQAAIEHKAQAVKANFYFYWSKPKERNEKNPLISPEVAGLVDPSEFFELFWYMPSIWSAIFERQFLNDNDIRFLETPGASYQDLAFTFKVWASAKRVVLIDEAFVHYRQDNEASSINSPGKVFCVCDEFDEIERFLENHPEKDYLQPVKTRLKFDSYIWNYWRLNGDLRTQFIERFAEDFVEEERRGHIDYNLFFPWTEADLRHILKDYKDYHRWAMETDGKQGSLAAFVRYFKLGGPSLVAKRMRAKE